VTPAAPVVCGVDEGYVLPFRVLLRSIAAAHPLGSAPRVIALHRGLACEARTVLHTEAEHLGLDFCMCETSGARPGYPVSGWVSDAVYLRLEIPDVLDGTDTALYLDADTVVLRDLRPLLTTSLKGRPLAAVRDPQHPVIGTGIALPGWRELGLPEGRDYFNSGVMLMDLRACRPVAQRCRDFLRERPQHVRFWDQDALNWALGDQWLRLPRTWNTFALSALHAHHQFTVMNNEAVMPLPVLLADESTASILHYAGPDKPWREGYPPGRVTDLYRSLLAETLHEERVR
jgi:lipopolysaccharide biosynthesis glycosyltransferase